MIRTETPRAPSSPEAIRGRDFSVRMRGLDPYEVRSFLNELAEDFKRIQGKITTLTQENQQLQSELEQARAKPHQEVTDRAVVLLNQAQQLADSLIDEAMQSARDLLVMARSQQRDIMEEADAVAKGAVARATTTAERVGSQDNSSPDVEYVQMFAKVAQVQFRAVLDALNEQVNRLGQLPEVAEPLVPISRLRSEFESEAR